jgi:tetratricopeptide (TPR) repeat protein
MQKKLLAEQPKTADEWKAKGNGYYQRKKYAYSIRCYNKAIELDGVNGAYYGNRGAAWHDLDENEKALADYNKAIELGETFARYCNRGRLFEKMKNYPKAIADYEKARTLDPNNPDMPRIVMGLEDCRHRAAQEGADAM